MEYLHGLPCSLSGKESTWTAGDVDSVPGSEDPLEKELAAHSSSLVWGFPWTEEPGGLLSMGCKESDSSDWATKKQVIYDFWWYRFSNSFAYWVSFLGLPYKHSKLSGLNNRTIASRFWRLDDQGVSRIIRPPKKVGRDLLQIFLLAPDNSLDHRRNLHMVSSLCAGLCVQIPPFHKNTSHNGLGIHPAPGGPHLNCYSAKLYF